MAGYIAGTFGPNGRPELPSGNLISSPFRDGRDLRTPETLGAALLALRRRAPVAPLSALYDRHEARLTARALDADGR